MRVVLIADQQSRIHALGPRNHQRLAEELMRKSTSAKARAEAVADVAALLPKPGCERETHGHPPDHLGPDVRHEVRGRDHAGWQVEPPPVPEEALNVRRPRLPGDPREQELEAVPRQLLMRSQRDRFVVDAQWPQPQVLHGSRLT